MHSQVGPWVEANLVYVDQSRLETVEAGTTPFVLYDVGMGTAANAVAMIEKWRSLGISRPLKIFSFEKYPDALRAALAFRFEFLLRWEEVLGNLLLSGETSFAGVQWSLISGDFRNLNLSVLPKPNLIYFDFYAQASCPELWSEEIFRRFDPSARLITYASNKSVRAALLLAGFYVSKGSSTSMKLETTVTDRDHLLNRDWLESLKRSPKNFPIERLSLHPQFKQKL
jgi:tRNA U34 5-methylaminomethyl-2-thiouridine-forming methyltransferase MnmC